MGRKPESETIYDEDTDFNIKLELLIWFKEYKKYEYLVFTLNICECFIFWQLI